MDSVAERSRRLAVYGGPAVRAAVELVRGEVDLSVEWAGVAVDERYQSIIGMFIRANRLTDLASRSYVSPFCVAQAYYGLGQVEPFRQAMDAALEERAGLLVFLNFAFWDVMRDDPYMAELRRKVGLPSPV